MKKIFVGAIIILMGIFIFTGLGNAGKINKKEVAYLSQNVALPNITGKVYSEIKEKGNANLIIVLKEEDKALKKEYQRGSRYKNFISLNANASQLTELEADPNVLSISYDYPIRISLQDSVPQINASNIWKIKLDEVNLTGQGQTICILDTGVNYSHPDLEGCYGNNNLSSSCKVIGGWDYVNNDADPLDDNGHGTHVSGIVAANGGIRGVAPDAKIVSIKVLDSSGGGTLTNIVKGIDWCVANSTRFNISVISMSLGTSDSGVGAYSNTNYCDEDFLSTFTASINAAVQKNISVVVASGNGDSGTGGYGFLDAISAPACVENALPVTSNNKADNEISYFANTWNNSSLLIVSAPGESINSTWYNVLYHTDQGTSMSAPHVSGAIAIMNQYLFLKGDKRTPREIESILNSTGKQVNDTLVSGRYFSRIDVYSAIISLCADNLVNTSWENLGNISSCQENNTILYNYSRIQYDSNNCGFTNNITYYLTNESSCDACVPNWTAVQESNLVWYNDTNDCYTQTNLSSDLLNRPLNISLSVDENKTEIFDNESNNSLIIELNFNLSNSNNTFEELNITKQNSTDNFSYTLVRGLNLSENISWLKTIYLDKRLSSGLFCLIDSENVGLGNFSTYCNSSSSEKRLSCPGSNENYVCSENGSRFKITGLRNSGIREISQFCGDGICNASLSETCSSCSTDCTVGCSSGGSGGSSGGGGGGGGTASKTYTLSDKNLTNGIVNLFSKGDKAKFNLAGINHTLELKSINQTGIILMISSEPINVSLLIDEERKINLTSPKYLDLEIKLENISYGKANISLKRIFESLPDNQIKENETQYDIAGDSDSISKKTEEIVIINYVWALCGIIAFVLFIVLLKRKVFYSQKSKKVNGTKKSKS